MQRIRVISDCNNSSKFFSNELGSRQSKPKPMTSNISSFDCEKSGSLSLSGEGSEANSIIQCKTMDDLGTVTRSLRICVGLFAQAPVTKQFRRTCNGVRYVRSSQMTRLKATFSKKRTAACVTPPSPGINLCSVDIALAPLTLNSLDRSMPRWSSRINTANRPIARPHLKRAEEATSGSFDEQRGSFGITATRLWTDQFWSGLSGPKNAGGMLGVDLSPFDGQIIPAIVFSRSIGAEYTAKREARFSATTRSHTADRHVTPYLRPRNTFGAVVSPGVPDIRARRTAGCNI
jgi:hypothetical protein